jgi:two-component system cell cycle response regulator DivK
MPLVLIVDDDADTRELYDAYLAIWGFDTSMAADGAEALRRVEGERPDVVVLDIRLPLVDGWEVTRTVKGNPKTSETFVIVLTGDTEPESLARSMAAGCDVFLRKPCVPEHLVVEVLRWSQRRAV